MSRFEDDDEALEDCDDLEELLEHVMDCSLDPRTGQCGQAGSEYCDFECRGWKQ